MKNKQIEALAKALAEYLAEGSNACGLAYGDHKAKINSRFGGSKILITIEEQEDADEFKEHDLVIITKVNDIPIPVGTIGTIISVMPGSSWFTIEFSEEFSGEREHDLHADFLTPWKPEPANEE